MTRLRLEEFSHPSHTAPAAGPEDADGLAAYEEGYAAGWEDAVAAQSDRRAELESEVGRSLAALSMTRQEARSQALQDLEPLLVAIGTQLLPEIARAALAPTVAAILLPLAGSGPEPDIRLRVGPAAAGALRQWLDSRPDLTVELTEDPALAGGQVVLGSPARETRIDLDAAATALLGAIRAFFDMHEMERRDAD